MNNFTDWMTLVLGIWFTISATINLYTDIKNHGITKWWRWVLDPLSLIVGISFIVEFIYIRYCLTS